MQDSGAASIDFDKSGLGAVKTLYLVAPGRRDFGTDLVSELSHSFTQDLESRLHIIHDI
jgi:hypothetical protein